MNLNYRLVALRVCSAFITKSDEAVLVVAGMIPVDILVNEMSGLYYAKRSGIPYGAEKVMFYS